MLQRRRLGTAQARPVTSVVLATALVASAAVGLGANRILQTQGSAIDPVTATTNTESFAAGANVVVDDPAIAAQGEGDGPRTVKEFTQEEQFSQFALTWTGEKDIAAYFRSQREDGSWSEWFSAPPLDYASDSPNAKNGTDLIYIEPTHKVQVSVSGVDLFADTAATEAAPAQDAAAPAQEAAPAESATPAEAAPAESAPAAEQAPAADYSAGTTSGNGTAPLPTNFGDIKPVADVEDTAGVASASDIEAVFMDGGESQLPAGGIELTADSDGMPRVISRQGWGANESLRCSSPTYDDGVSAVVIHHTAGSNNYTESQAPGIVRGIYQYHAQTLGWCDIGYNAFADKYGNLYEGRYGGLNKAVHGAHAGGFNTNTWAISMIGNYDTAQTTPAMIQSVGELAGWRAKVAGFDPKGTDTHYSEGSNFTFYPYGQAVSLPNIFAHRDVGTTACPGQYGYAQMGNIRDIAKQKYNSILSGSTGSTTTKTTTAAAPTTVASPADTPNTQAPVVSNGDNGTAPNNSNGTTTGGINNTAGLDAAALLTNLAGSSNSTDASAFGSLISVALAIASILPGTVSVLGDVQIADGLKLSQLIPVVTAVSNFLSNSDNLAAATTLINYLGNARTGVASYAAANGETVSYQLFDNGIVLDSSSTGQQALWGAIGDAWAAQGFDRGPLGLPVNQEYDAGGLKRVDFQGGYITYNPATGAVDIQTN